MTGCLLNQSKHSTLSVDRIGLLQSESCCDNSSFPVSLILVAGMLLALWCAMPSYAGDARTTSLNQRPIVDLEPHYRASVLRGWRSFQTSYAQDGLACVHCHLGHDSLRPWAGAYPKVQVFDGTPYRVKGLRQVVLEALENHSDLLPDQRLTLVEDLIAYIVWWGDGQAIKPGHSNAFPPAREDLAQLGSARERGRRLFQQESLGPCVNCHSGDGKGLSEVNVPVVYSVAKFPRYVASAGRVISFETFLSGHILATSKRGYSAESPVVTDLIAYLASLSKGKRLRPGIGGQ